MKFHEIFHCEISEQNFTTGIGRDGKSYNESIDNDQMSLMPTGCVHTKRLILIMISNHNHDYYSSWTNHNHDLTSK